MRPLKESNLKIPRRAFFGISFASLGWSPFAVSAETDTLPFAARLSLGNFESESGLAAIFRQLSEVGFQGVELSGDYVGRAEEIKGGLDGTGLVCAAVRIPLSDLLGARFEEVAQANRVFQNQNLIVSGGLDRPLCRTGGNRFVSYFFNRLACKAEDAGFRIGLCLQPDLLTQIEDGVTAWDSFFCQTDPRVIAEIDMKICAECNTDPSMMLQKTAERAALISVSDDLFSEDGQRPLSWPRFLSLCRTIGNTPYFVLELEADDGQLSPAEKIASRFEKIREIMGCL